jgi:phosphoribosylanthranilate isomerase
MIVQIYEIQTPQEAEKCINLGVDHIGSVLPDNDEWQIPSLKTVIRLSYQCGTKSSLIPLFHDIDRVSRALDYYCPHYLHLCENLTDYTGNEIDLKGIIKFQSDLKKKFPEIQIIRSIPIPPKGMLSGFPSLNIAKTLEPVSDIFLSDTWLGSEPVEGYIGITGKTVDWLKAKQLVLQSKIPVILAGGLSPENVAEAVKEVMPAGADSCTHTNMTDADGRPVRFKKDFRKVDKFVKAVRQFEIEVQGLRL